MQPKIICSPAWAAQEGMLDTALAALLNIHLTNIVQTSKNDTCPHCGNPPADSIVQLLTEEAAPTPDKVSGHVIVRCLCESVYAYAYVHEVSTQEPLGEARVRAASAAPAPKVEEPPPMRWGQHPAYDLAHSRRADWDYEYYQGYSAPSAAEIWAANEAAKREADGPSAAS